MTTTPAQLAQPGQCIVRPVNSQVCILQFEGVTIRSDVLEALEAIAEAPLSSPEVARRRRRSDGATAKTLQRLVELELADKDTALATLKTRNSTRQRTVGTYVATNKGRRLLVAAGRIKAEMASYLDDSDPELSWPRVDPATVVRQALRTQPNSVFDMGRLCRVPDVPLVVAAPNRPPVNSVFALAA